MHPLSLSRRNFSGVLGCAALALAIGGCATNVEPDGPPRKEMVYAVNDGGELIRFNAGQPRRILERKPLTGLATGERLLGLDYRVARGVLFAMSTAGRLYTLDTASARLTPVGAQPLTLPAGRYGFDFNPSVDRIRVMSDGGLNLRIHPDTGAVVGTDPAPRYAAGDRGGAGPALIAAAAYTYNKRDDKLTTNFAIDLRSGALVTQGTREGVTPAVSPNTGILYTVGELGAGPLEDASLDISDVDNTALAALRVNGRTGLYLVDLSTGRAQRIGTIGDGRPILGLAIEP